MDQSLDDDLSVIALSRVCGGNAIGHTVLRYRRVTSTSDIARRCARRGDPAGVVVLADEQTAGRGRRGRQWVMPAGALACSVVLRPALAPCDAYLITIAAGLAVCEALEAVAPLRARLAWPNDVVVDDANRATPAKVAGLLGESASDQHTLHWVVLGIGINVAAAPAGHVDGYDLAQRATSLAQASGVAITRSAVLLAVLAALERWLAADIAGRDRAALLAAWRGRLSTLGQRVELRRRSGPCRGVAIAVTGQGGLVVRHDDGTLTDVSAGEVDA
jgi:BirA family biotin operon repressor/biotin-[acetyl-CoA-carboxylase] ligase